MVTKFFIFMIDFCLKSKRYYLICKNCSGFFFEIFAQNFSFFFNFSNSRFCGNPDYWQNLKTTKQNWWNQWLQFKIQWSTKKIQDSTWNIQSIWIFQLSSGISSSQCERSDGQQGRSRGQRLICYGRQGIPFQGMVNLEYFIEYNYLKT